MSARTLSRYNAFVRARNKNSACVSQSLFLSFSLCLACRFPLSSPCFRLRRVLCRLSCSLLLAQPLFAPISLVPIRLRFPLSTAPLSSPPLYSSSRCAIARDILSLSLSRSVPSRTSPRSLSFSPVFRFARRVHSQFPSFPFVLDNLTSLLVLFPSPCIIAPSSSFFFSIFVCILLHFSFSSTSLRSVVHSPPLSPLLLVWTLSLVHFRVFPRPSVIARGLPVVSSSSWLPSTGLVRTHTFPYTGKFVHGLASSTVHPSSFIFVFRFRRDLAADFSPTVVLYIFFRALNKHVNRAARNRRVFDVNDTTRRGNSKSISFLSVSFDNDSRNLIRFSFPTPVSVTR